MNKEVAKKLRQIAALLEKQNANPFRINAYRRAANTVDALNVSVQELIEKQGIIGLTTLHGIGQGIARSIYEYIATGKMTRLESLQGESDPIRLFKQIPGVGTKIAHEIYEQLHINTLEALEVAAHNGRLSKLSSIGKNRMESIQTWLDKVLGTRRSQYLAIKPIQEPAISLLLQIDLRYCNAAVQNKLPKIAPKRFNPSGKAWLPILHSSRGDWHFTMMYSNSRRAHDLGRTRDWVIIYYYDKDHLHEGQNTVVTETHGQLKGKRVVRGRELECQEYYSHKLAI